MKAFILDRYGSADHVRAGDMPDPELREDDVLVQVHAQSTHYGRSGLHPPGRLDCLAGADRTTETRTKGSHPSPVAALQHCGRDGAIHVESPWSAGIGCQARVEDRRTPAHT